MTVLASVFSGLAAASVAAAYPVTYDSCGVTHTLSTAPQRIITLNQGATEFLLALGLADRMVATAYLDDEIWPAYKTAYDSISTHISGYPTQEQIFDLNADFLVGSYNSAFREKYNRTRNGVTSVRGIYDDSTVGPCEGTGADWPDYEGSTCRPQLHSNGVGTYLFPDACEDSSLRPTEVSEAIVYQEVRDLGAVFGLTDSEIQAIIDEMQQDFDAAAAVITGQSSSGLTAVWLDCIDCCGEGELFVGGGTGAPHMLMQEAGLTNLYADRQGNWICANESDVKALDPDVMIVVDAAWDTAALKLQWIYNQSFLCDASFITGAHFVQIPFSASTLGPRNGAAALDLAKAAVLVQTEGWTLAQWTADTTTQDSGVMPLSFLAGSSGLVCLTTTTAEPEPVSGSTRSGMGVWCTVLMLLLASRLGGNFLQ